MPDACDIGISFKAFQQLRREYRKQWKVPLLAVDVEGKVIFGEKARKTPPSRRGAYRHAIREALRWGEPTVGLAPTGMLVWAVPVLRNARLLGGLVASTAEKRVFPDGTGTAAFDVRQACTDLRVLAEKANLTNAALLESRRREYDRERHRAEAIHEIKLVSYISVREMYLRDEPALIAAIRKDDRAEARGILNRLLTAIHHRAGHRLDLIKSFFMELVATMCRTAVEAGGNPESVFGENFASISELSRITSEEQLAPWLHEMLESIMDSIRSHRGRSPSHIVSEALRHMAEHCCEGVSRDETARAVHVSPSHLSRMIKKHVGRGYTDLVNQMRTDRACELLARTDRPLAMVAMDTGFADQSYFTKVFRHYTGLTPRQYRRKRRASG